MSNLFVAGRGWGKTIAVAVVVAMAVAAVAQACNVPVFRFALERWRADAYRVTIFHAGELTAADEALVTRLEEQQDKGLANLIVRTVDVQKFEEDGDRELFDQLGKPASSTLVLQYPFALKIEVPLLVESLNAAAVKRMLESPLRQQLLNRLVEGETAVWVLLESGDAEKDNKAAALLKEQLVILAKELRLPELTDLPDDNLLAKTPLKLSFSTLRVPRSKADDALVQMLIRCESDLIERAEPMVFPVFGRGRAMLPLLGAGITEDNIAGYATFLVGACSCEVKDQNPGFDLLLAADWDELLSHDGQRLAIVSRRDAPAGPPELLAIPPGSKSEVSSKEKLATDSSGDAKPARLSSNASGASTAFTLMALGGTLVAIAVLINLNRKFRAES